MKNVLPVVLSVLAVAAGGCHKSREVTAPNLPPVAVRVETVESRERASTEDVVGTVRPRLHAAIGAKISGRIRQLLVVPGQRVQPGELLAALEAGEMQARLDQALAVRAQAEADLKRYTALYDQKILSPAEFDAAQSRFRIADAAAKEAQAMMDYTRITAPFAGVITRKLADVGDLVGDPTMPNRPILEMEDPTALRLEADVPEAVIGKLAVGDKLPVRIGSLDGELAGVISEIAPAGDPSSRTFLVKLDLPETPGLRTGQFGRVSMPVGTTRVLQAPVSALVTRGQMEIVFVVRDNKALLRLVKSGRKDGGLVELVSGVDAGEKLVTDGAAGLMDGQPLTIKP